MWTSVRDKIKALRTALKTETDEKVKAKLEQDIEGFKKRKNEFGQLLGV